MVSIIQGLTPSAEGLRLLMYCMIILTVRRSQPGERAPTNVVSAFSKSLKSFQTGVNQVEQENRALSNYMRDSGPLVVPH